MSGRHSSAVRGNDRFTARRRSRRRRVLVASLILLLLLLAAATYGLDQDTFRISRVQIFGADQSLSTIVLAAMEGRYLGIVPRNSTFFFPSTRIRAEILATDPNIAAVSIFRSELTGLSIRIDNRTPIARWCGASLDATRFNLNATSSRSNLVADCYVFDASGLIYAAFATSTETINSFKLYAPLEGVPPKGVEEEPLGTTIAQAEKLPATFDFARQLVTFGSPISHVVIHDGEVDEYLTSGTRVTYVLGNEQNAFTALVSGRANFNLANGSIEYIDLRFDGKVYLKRK